MFQARFPGSGGRGRGGPVVGFPHGNINVFKNFTGCDALRAIRGEDKIIPFLSGVLPAQAVDEGEWRVKLPSFDQEASAIRCPFTDHFIHWICILPGEEDGAADSDESG